MVAESGFLNGFPDGRDRGEDPRGGLVVDRHHDGGASRERRGLRRDLPAEEQGEKADDRRAEGQRDPREVDGEERNQHPLQHRGVADGHDLHHLPHAVGGHGRSAAEDGEPREPGHGKGLRRLAPLGPRVETPQGLGRHRERCLGRHRVRDGRHQAWIGVVRHGVQRYSHVSLAALPAASSSRRNSEAVSFPGSSSKVTRSVRLSG
jgi:hypothetical protein